MKIKIALLLSIVAGFILGNGALFKTDAQQKSYQDIEPKSVTLFSQGKHNNFAKANFNFQLGVRGDSTLPRTQNNHDLRYGGFTFDTNSDWFEITTDDWSYSRITDIGKFNWTDIYDVPILHAAPEPHTGMHLDYAKGIDNVKVTPENTLVKVVLGHIYLIHAKEVNRANETTKDFYAMFRVEALKPSDEVTISWKIVPSPENQ